MAEDVSELLKPAIPQELKEIFDERSAFESLPEGGYFIRTQLKDGIVEGGQNVEITLSEKVPLGIYKQVDTDSSPIEIEGYRVRSMIVNGAHFLETGMDIYLESPKSEPASKPQDLNEQLIADFSSEITFPVRKLILMKKIQSGDHLVFLRHSMGHIKNNTDPEQVELDRKEWVEDAIKRHLSNLGLIISSALPSKNGAHREISLVKPSGVEVERLLRMLGEERRASLIALDDIQAMNERGADLFPNDPDLLRVKKCLITGLITYVQWDKGLQRELPAKAYDLLNF